MKIRPLLGGRIGLVHHPSRIGNESMAGGVADGGMWGG
jgi:hypothetical protein